MKTRLAILLLVLGLAAPFARATNTPFALWPTNTPTTLLGTDANGYGLQIELSTLTSLVSVGGVATNFYRLTSSPVGILGTNDSTLLYTLTLNWAAISNILGYAPGTNGTLLAKTNPSGYGTLTLIESDSGDDTFLQPFGTGGFKVDSTANPFDKSTYLSPTGIVAGTIYARAFTTNLHGNLTGTNFTARGTNTFPLGADIAFATKQLTTLVNGYNAGLTVGTNVFLEVSGPTAAFTICGIDGQPNRDGKLVWVINRAGYAMTVAHESGSEGTAANRILTPTYADIATTTNGYAVFRYSTTSNRWTLLDIYPTSSSSIVTYADTTNAATSVVALQIATGSLISAANATNAANYAISNHVIPYAATSGTVTGSVSYATAAGYAVNSGSVTGAVLAANIAGPGNGSSWTNIYAPGTGANSVKVGDGAAATGTGTISIGYNSGAGSTNGAIALGSEAGATGSDSIAIGAMTSASAWGASALGAGASAANAGSTAIGALASTTADRQVMLGTEIDSVQIPGLLSIAGRLSAGGGLVLSNTAAPPTPPTSGGSLWVSNSVLYWVTATKTNSVSDGR